MRTPPRVMPAIVMPFDDGGELDLEGHVHNLLHLQAAGISGFLIGGSTGEGPYLEPGERRAALESARETLGEAPFLLCGIAAESVRHADRQIDEAADAADAVLVLTPTALVRGRHDAVERYYETVADAAPIPVFLYTVPGVTGYELPVSAIASLAAHANVAGIKDSGGKPERIKELTDIIGDELFLYAGASRSLHASIAGGGYGAITSSANYVPRLVQELATAAAENDRDVAADRQGSLTELTQRVEVHGLTGVKVMAELSGLRPGATRAPLLPLDEITKKSLTELLPLSEYSST